MGVALPDFVLKDIALWLEKGCASFAVPAPITLPIWAEQHFYLSAESSYVEQSWRPWSFQVAILACMGHDDIEEVDVKKSARVGYTKMLLAAACYFLHHKRRNAAIWQPTDEDRDQFVKTELEPAFRDVACMKDIFPSFLAKNKANTLKQKMLLGCTIHTLGGKAAKNYRRISVDVGILDEISGFDLNIENEGAPFGLAAKRVEGASFPKMIVGSTPKIRGFCQIESRVAAAQHVFRRHIPCPHCGEYHRLTWGDAKSSHGMKWEKRENDEATADTVRQLCPHCGVLYTQSEFIRVEAQGEWRTDTGMCLRIDEAGTPVFMVDRETQPIPRHVAFDDLWSAYSPNVSWVSILRDYLAAVAKARKGDDADLQTWTNTTLGQTYLEEGDKTDANELARRVEAYQLRTIPLGGLILTAGVDTQDDRWEITVWAHGRDSEMWCVDYTVLYGNPGVDTDWDKLDAFLKTRYRHASGQMLPIEAVAIDTGGHFTHHVYNFCRTRERRRIFAVKGEGRPALPIKGRASMQDVNWRGRILKHGVKLWHVGTDTAKDLLHGQLKVTQPGPGYVHFSRDLPPSFFDGLTIEQRLPQKTATGTVFRWVNPNHGRNEPLDCTVYALFAAHALDLHRYTHAMWLRLEAVVQPPTGDLFLSASPVEPVDNTAEAVQTSVPEPADDSDDPPSELLPTISQRQAQARFNELLRTRRQSRYG